MTWHWLRQGVAVAIHDEQIVAHGGSPGIRDAGLLASALARAQNKAAYGVSSPFDLAAAYAYGIVMDHPFVDGNKRTGFLAAYVFLDLHGWLLEASEAEAVGAVLALATREMGEAEFSSWLKAYAVRSPGHNREG